MTDRTLYLGAYDVSDPARLRRALHAVKAYATGGQKSAYECFLTEAERAALLDELGAILDPAEDAFLLLRLDSRATVHTLGIAVPPEDPPFFYHG